LLKATLKVQLLAFIMLSISLLNSLAVIESLLRLPYNSGSFVCSTLSAIVPSSLCRCQFHQYFTSSFFTIKFFCAAFICLQFGFLIFWRKDFGAKADHKMLVKLTTGQLGAGWLKQCSVGRPCLKLVRLAGAYLSEASFYCSSQG
jgi:hypothetical protein